MRQVVVQGIEAIIGAAAGILLLIAFAWFLRRLWQFAQKGTPEGWMDGTEWVPFGVSAFLLLLIGGFVVQDVGANINTALNDFINPGWAAIQLLLHLVKK